MKEELILKSGHKLTRITYHSRFVAAINTTSVLHITRCCVLITILEDATVRIVRHQLEGEVLTTEKTPQNLPTQILRNRGSEERRQRVSAVEVDDWDTGVRGCARSASH
jgi:hypothetical protein